MSSKIIKEGFVFFFFRWTLCSVFLLFVCCHNVFVSTMKLEKIHTQDCTPLSILVFFYNIKTMLSPSGPKLFSCVKDISPWKYLSLLKGLYVFCYCYIANISISSCKRELSTVMGSKCNSCFASYSILLCFYLSQVINHSNFIYTAHIHKSPL